MATSMSKSSPNLSASCFRASRAFTVPSTRMFSGSCSLRLPDSSSTNKTWRLFVVLPKPQLVRPWTTGSVAALSDWAEALSARTSSDPQAISPNAAFRNAVSLCRLIWRLPERGG